METVSLELETVRTAYEQRREEERRKLSIFLTEYIDKHQVSLKVIRGERAGKGWVRYSSGGRIAPYNLSNWKWVELVGADSDFNCVVSLNMPDIDPHSGNTHFLFDRVGLLISFSNDQLYYKTEILTDIDLPFDTIKMERMLLSHNNLLFPLKKESKEQDNI